MTKPKLAGLAALAVFIVAPVAVVRSQAPSGDAAESPIRLDEAGIAALSNRGPVNSDELAYMVRAHLAANLDQLAADVVAGYLRDRSEPEPGENIAVEALYSCAYCVAQLARLDGSAPDGELRAVLTALETIQREAYASGDGNPLVELALTLRDSVADFDSDLGPSFLLDAFAIGNLTDEMKMAAADLLGRRGWYEPARALVEQVHEDPSSPLHQSATTSGWLAFFDTQISREQALKERLASEARETELEYVPVFKVMPYYPEAAAGVEGHVIVEFTVTELGRTADIEVVQSSNPVFDEAALWAVRQFRYMPRIVAGTPTAVEGVRNKITFRTAPGADRLN